MALDKFQPYLFVSAGEQSNKFLTPAYSGGIASFQAQRAQQLTKLLVQIDPVQDGTGDPAPDNIRPISGRTGMTVTAAGVNVWDEEWETGIYGNTYGDPIVNGNRVRSKNPIPVSPSTTYYLYCGNASIGIVVHYFDASGTQLTTASVKNAVFTPPANTAYILFNSSGSDISTYNNDISINRPSTDTTYHAYAGHTYPISWQTEAGGTIYGGTLNVTTGVLTVDRVCVAITNTSFSWSKSSSYPGSFYINLGTFANLYDVPQLKTSTPFICSHAKNVTRLSDYAYGCCYMDGSLNICIMDENATAQDWLNYLASQVTAGTPVQVCCQLATPQTYQLTPTEVQTIAGYNQIYADTGAILDVEF